MFKKVISIVLTLMLVCSVFTGTLATNVSAEASLPTFDSATQSKLVNWSGSINASTPFNATLDVKDKSAAAYVQYVVTTNTNTTTSTNTQWVAPNVKIASVTYNNTNYALVLRMTSQHGHTLGLYPENDYNADPVKTFWGNVDYPEQESQIYSGSYTITAKVEGNSINIWWGDMDVTSGEVGNYVWDLSNLAEQGVTVNGLNVGAGYNWGGYDFTLKATAWTAKENSNIVYGAGHYQVQNISGVATQTNTTAKFWNDYAGVTDATGVVYTSINTSFSSTISSGNGWYSPYILVAETDYKKSEADTDTWYLGVRLTMYNGWVLALFNPSAGQAKTLKDGHAYADGTKVFKNDTNITAKVGDGKVSLWVDGLSVLFDYTGADYKIVKSVVGSMINGYGYGLSINAWVEADNYKYLIPTFDADNQVQIQNIAGMATQTNTTATFWNDFSDAIDETDVIYTSINTSFSSTISSGNGWYSPFILVAETNYKKSETDTDTWYLGVRLTMYNGWVLALFNPSAGQAKTLKDGYAYADGTKVFKNGTNITAKVGDGMVSLWIDGMSVLFDYTSTDYNIVKSVIGSMINGYGYNMNLTAWTDTTNYKYALPEFDEEAQINLFQSGETIGSTAIHYDAYLDGMIADTAKPVWVEYTLDIGNSITGWYSPVVWLADTDYNDDSGYYLALVCYGDHGYAIGYVNDSFDRVGMFKNNVNYPNNNSQTLSKGQHKVIVKTEGGAVSVWLDGTLILKNYKPTDANITGAAYGGYINGYSFGLSSKTYVDNENYGKLGDLNADKNIDILDLIGMYKLAAADETYTAFNDAVKAFNDEGTINTKELIQMKKYLLGIIDKLTVTDGVDYGEDVTDASGIY